MAGPPAFESRQRTKPREGGTPIRARYGDLVCTGRAGEVLEDSGGCELPRQDAAANGCSGLILRKWPADGVAYRLGKCENAAGHRGRQQPATRRSE
jgi:hypothetical protein